jgi:hypothetical protein
VVQNFWSRTMLGTALFRQSVRSAPRPQSETGAFRSPDRIIHGRRSQGAAVEAAERAVAKVQHMSLCFQAGLVSPVPGYAQGAASQTSGTEVPS